MTRRWLALGAGGVLLAGLAAGAWLRTRPAPTPPNVIVVVWDTVRADHLSLYGYHRPTTPNLEALGRESVVFDAARAPGIWTLPSHASLFTGRWPESHGAEERWMWLDGRFHTMAEHFDAAGYATLSVAANALLCDETNLVQGFGTRANTWKGALAKQARAATLAKLLPGDRSNELAPDWTPPEHGATNAEWKRAIFKDAAPVVTERLLAWVDRQDAPYFAFVNLMEAHTPRVPTMASRKRVLADDPELVDLGLQTDAAHIRLHFYNFGKEDYTDRQLAAINGVYDAALRDLDDALGTLVEGLRQRGQLDDTVLVVTADHGENLGDHHRFNHRFGLWDSLAHVPLVVHAPGLAPGRRSEPVSTLDVFATVARLAGLPAPPTDGGDLFLAPAPAVTTLITPLRREISSVQNVHPDVDEAPWLRSGHALVQGTRKLVAWSDGVREAYDLEVDPGERHPLPDDPALGAAFDTWSASLRRYDESERGPGDQPAHVRAGQGDLREQLEALGYVGGDEP